MRLRVFHQLLWILLGTTLAAWPASAAQQQQTNSEDQQQTQQTQATPGAQTQPSQTQDAQQAPTTPQQSTPPELPDIKKGSKNDVEAIGNRNVGKGLNFISLEKEIEIGKMYAQQVEKSSTLVTDPVINEYINRVGQNLVRNSDARVPFTIKVIQDDSVNAFALPGGFFYVNSGLILKAQEEDELAGVMGHEIAHVCARHWAKEATKGELTQLAMIPMMIFLPYGWAGYGIYQGLNFGIPIAFLKFSRDHEREADYLGLQYMYKAGYDPNAYVTFFERLTAMERRTPGSIPKVFSDHPPTPDRIVAAQKEIAQILPARDDYIVTTSEFDQVKARLRSIVFAKKLKDNSEEKPTLKKKTEDPNKGKTPTDTTSTSSTDDDDRPVLKKRQ
jgi:predicted Zn-dependent protease